MTEPANVLEFSNVVLPATPPGQVEMRQLNFTLRRGCILLVQLETDNEYIPLADTAEGLITPEAGLIRWQGREWSKLEPHEELSARSRIGRVFEKNGWLSNLNVNENVTLCQRHHTGRPENDIIAEADSLARFFGLPEVPRRRPAFVSKHELRVAEWVRALIGKPVLLLLERPETGVPDNNLPRLIEAVQAALQRGAAAI